MNLQPSPVRTGLVCALAGFQSLLLHAQAAPLTLESPDWKLALSKDGGVERCTHLATRTELINFC